MQDGKNSDDLAITSSQNPKIKQLVSLRERRDRDKEGLFLIEGFREVTRAFENGIPISQLFYCPDYFLGENEPFLIEQIRQMGSAVYRCGSRVFRNLSYRDRPDGLIAIAPQLRRGLADLPPIAPGTSPLFLIAEAIEKPGNLGSILRSCDAAGASGVIVCDRCTDIYNPNVVRASVGTLFTQPIVEATSAETFLWLQEKKVKIVAATPSAKVDYFDVDLRGPIAIAVGTEQVGLSEIWMHAADLKVKIPMNGKADSLNVATATTLLLYEVYRQRRG